MVQRSGAADSLFMVKKMLADSAATTVRLPVIERTAVAKPKAPKPTLLSALRDRRR
ncbi:MAG TPA: hypothetical protein VGM90_09085 [Kofleriaceae bacterium]|jgi:hypothetical protein